MAVVTRRQHSCNQHDSESKEDHSIMLHPSRLIPVNGAPIAPPACPQHITERPGGPVRAGPARHLRRRGDRGRPKSTHISTKIPPYTNITYHDVSSAFHPRSDRISRLSISIDRPLGRRRGRALDGADDRDSSPGGNSWQYSSQAYRSCRRHHAGGGIWGGATRRKPWCPPFAPRTPEFSSSCDTFSHVIHNDNIGCQLWRDFKIDTETTVAIVGAT